MIETEYPDGMVSRTCYDELGRSQYTQERAQPDGGNATTAPAMRNTYDASGRVIRVEKFASVKLTKTDASNGTDYNGPATGLLKLVADAPTVGAMTTNLTFYDAVGRVNFSVDARGAVTQNLCDAAGRRTNTLVYPTYCYWEHGDGTVAPAPTGTPLSTSYTYDANGNQVTVTDAMGHTTTSLYDEANRVTEVDVPSTTNPSNILSRKTAYDGLGRKLQETDEAGMTTAYSYDFRGLLNSVTLAYGTTQAVTTVYGYDELGNQISQTDAVGHQTTFHYDGLGRRTSRTLPAGQSELMAYDLAGNLARQTNFNGVIITNQYDWMGRLTNRGSVNGYQASFAYDAITGMRTNMIDVSGTNSWRYNDVGQLTNKVVSWINGPTLALNYRYNAFGSLTNLGSSSVNGVTNNYAYDLLGRLTNVLAGGSAAAGYGYDAVGNLQSQAYGNGVTNLYQYDSRNRLTNQVWRSGSTILASFFYTVAATGNRTALLETNNGAVRTYGWTYDNLYRLTGETFGVTGNTGTVGYGFDAVGNRTSRTSTVTGISPKTSSYTANDLLTSDSYDANGNTTSSSSIGYQYDALDHLTNMNNGAVLIAYDGDGNRTRKTVSGSPTTSTYYLLDDRNPSGYVQVLEEWTTAGTATNLSRVFSYGHSLISQRQGTSGTVSYYGTDGHGSTRFLLSTLGHHHGHVCV